MQHPMMRRWGQFHCYIVVFRTVETQEGVVAGMQGDAEKKRGMPVSPLCDRDKVEVPKSQLAFLTYVVKPTFEALKGLAPVTAGNALDNIDIAVRHWEQQALVV